MHYHAERGNENKHMGLKVPSPMSCFTVSERGSESKLLMLITPFLKSHD